MIYFPQLLHQSFIPLKLRLLNAGLGVALVSLFGHIHWDVHVKFSQQNLSGYLEFFLQADEKDVIEGFDGRLEHLEEESKMIVGLQEARDTQHKP